jgi:CRP-like cAMP-binding protein
MSRSQKTPRTELDGNRVYNEILLQVPENEAEIIFPQLEYMRLNTHHLLHEAGDKVKSAYFCNSGIVSILSVFPDATCVEVGLVGKEGFVGLPLIAGFRTTPTRAVAQTESTVFRIDASALMEILEQCPKLERKLQQFVQISAAQVTQIAACNRLHDIQQRLARWLLMSADRIGNASLPLTQELLAQMLGTRRSTVTIAAGIFQGEGLIRYSRGVLTIVDRRGLEEVACDCYRLMKKQVQTWQGSSEAATTFGESAS